MTAKLIKNIVNPGESLKWKTAQGFIVVLFGDAYLNALRLIGNLVMTRLLYPEAFGLMLIVNLVFTAVHMLSDAGIKQAIIVHGHDKGAEFLNTAWTLLCIRGVALCLITCLLAWPISAWYQEPALFGLIIVMSLSSLVIGFSSPHEAIYDRNIKTLRSILLQAFSHTVALIAILIWLLIYPTIWALVGHGIISAALYTYFSYKIFEGQKPTFHWDKEAAAKIIGFGKWIMLSTALTFVATQGDRLVISNWISVAELGVFSIAISLAKVTETISGSISVKLLLPVFSEMRKGSSEQLSRRAMRVELLLFFISAPLILLFAIFGDRIIEFLYDPRYRDAGWMLQVMVVGTLFSAYNEALTTLIIAHTHSHRAAVLQFVRVVLMLSTLLIGGYFAGLVGLVYAIAIAPALFYLVLLFNMGNYNISPKVELNTIAFTLSSVYLAWHFMGWPGLAP